MVTTQTALGRNQEEIYGSMYSSSGNYTLRFSGDVNDIDTQFISGLPEREEELEEIFKLYYEKYSLEKLFLKIIEDEFQIDGIDLYKLNDDGTVVQKKLNNNNEVVEEPC